MFCGGVGHQWNTNGNHSIIHSMINCFFQEENVVSVVNPTIERINCLKKVERCTWVKSFKLTMKELK